MKILKQFALIVLMSVVVTACTPNISPNQYATTEVGQANKTVPGVIVNARQVVVTGSDDGNNWGALGGGAVGAVAGSAIGGGARMNILGGIAGAIGGALVGNAIQNSATTQCAMEYIVRIDNGELITVTQAVHPLFNKGQQVYVIFGDRVRIIPTTYYQ